MRVTIFSIISLVFFSGCASITGSSDQSLSLTAADKYGIAVEEAKCTLKNDKGGWDVKSPSFVNVRRSAGDLSVVCKKDGFPNGLLKAISRAGGGMFGNIILGGGIGAVIDHSSGKGYNYPDELPVVMGESIVVDRRDTNKRQNSGSTGDESK